MEIQGIVKNVGSTQEISDKFKKRELIVEFKKGTELVE